MKTLTEFQAFPFKNAHKTKHELTAAGKTAEELPAALGEALKLEGDKLTRLTEALEVVGDRLDDLKRVLVMQLGEGETAPTGAVQKGELWYIAEYFPPIGKKEAKGRDERGPREGRGGGRDGKRGGRGGKRGGGRDDRGGGRERSDRGGKEGPSQPRAPLKIPQIQAGPKTESGTEPKTS